MPRAKTTKKTPKTATKTLKASHTRKISESPSLAVAPLSFFPATFKDAAWIRNRKVIVGIVLVIVLLILIIPHLVVAWVDNRPVTIFEYYNALDSKYGSDTKEQLISERLIEDEAQRRHVTVAQSEVSAQVKKTEDQASGSANLDLALQQQGLTRADFEKQIRLQLLIQKMFGNQATVSAQEVDQYIEQNKDQLGVISDQTRKNVEDQLKQQKLLDVFRAWLQQAQNSNRVNRL